MQANEPERGLIDTLSYRQKIVIMQDARLTAPQHLCDALPLFTIEDHTFEGVVHGVQSVKARCVLSNHIKLFAKDRESFPVYRVSMAGSCR